MVIALGKVCAWWKVCDLHSFLLSPSVVRSISSTAGAKAVTNSQVHFQVLSLVTKMIATVSRHNSLTNGSELEPIWIYFTPFGPLKLAVNIEENIDCGHKSRWQPLRNSIAFFCTFLSCLHCIGDLRAALLESNSISPVMKKLNRSVFDR